MPSNITTSEVAPPTSVRHHGTQNHRARRGRATAVAAAAAGLALAVSGLTAGSADAAGSTGSSGALAAAATTPSNPQVAKYGASYLARQIEANDGFLGSAATPDLTDTAYAVIGLHAAGVGSRASGEAIAWLKTQVGSGLSADDGTDDPGRLSYVILAAVSAGQNPRAFGGTAARNNLVNRLLATARTSGADRGLFGSAAPTFDGAFRQGFALAALAGAGVPKTRVAASISWLTTQQCADGLWTAYRSNRAKACPAANPDTFAGPDTNSTSAAAQGLAAFGSQPRKWLLIKAIRGLQGADGGFPFLAAAGQASDPNSTALSIQALIAYGAYPALPNERSGGISPFTALARYQLGCAAPVADRGAFTFSVGDGTPNLFASVQAVPAMARMTFPVASRAVSTATPRQPCTAATVTNAATAPATSLAAAQPFAVAKIAGTAGACKGTTGVTVAVDFTAFPGGKVQVRCAPGKPATGVAALQQAGFTPAGTTRYGLAFVCRINSLPSTAQQACVSTPPATAYWAYYHANKGATTWTFSTTGASTYKPAQGSIDAWAFGNGAKPSKTPAQVRATKS